MGFTPKNRQPTTLKVADEVWIAVALLHRSSPDRPDFSIDEIIARAQRENITGTLRPGVYVHVIQHCVANRPPNPGRYRMLYETAPGRRRLYRAGDSYDSRREGSKTTPSPADIPAAYKYLLDWYEQWSSDNSRSAVSEDPLLRMAAVGSHIWKDEDPDEYVRQLREGWE